MKWKSILAGRGGRTFSIRHQTGNEFTGGDGAFRQRDDPFASRTLIWGGFPTAAMILSPEQHSET